MKEFFLLVAAILIWGVVWRFLAKFWRGKGRGAFTSHLGAAVVGFVVSMVFFGALAPKREPTSNAATSSSAATASAVSHAEPASGPTEETPTSSPASAAIVTAASTPESKDNEENSAVDDRDLGITPDQYAARFDELVKAMDLPFRARFAHKQHGDAANSVRADLDERMGLIGRVSKTSGKLIEVTFIGGSDGSADTAANIMLVAAASLTAAIPGVAVKSVAPKIADMLTKYKEGGEHQERVLNGVKIYYMRGDQLGHWFGAEPS